MRRIIFWILFLLISFIFLLIAITWLVPGKVNQENDAYKKIKPGWYEGSASHNYSRGKLFTYLFGTHYRAVWNIPVQAPALDISAGGFVATGTGGNMQTVSLKLKSADNKSYVVRPLDKDQSKALPFFWRKTIVGTLVKDQASAMFPYGALVVAPLMQSAGLLHASPKLVFIPHDSAIRSLDPSLEGKLGMLEEAPDSTWVQTSQFQNARSIVDTKELLQKIFTDIPRVQVDVHAFLKCRIMDLFVNDWDRHTGQWRWALVKQEQKFLYTPIPKDRDMAFYLFDDGLINKAALWINPKFQSFHGGFSDVPALVYNGSYIDRLLLSTLPRADFLEASKFIQSRLTDTVLQNAISKLPFEVSRLYGKTLFTKLRARRQALTDAAIIYYEHLMSHAFIVLSDQSESVHIVRHDSATVVSVNRKSDHTIVFAKTFTNSKTGKIRVECMGGNDHLRISGAAQDGPEITIYGGSGKDEYWDTSKINEDVHNHFIDTRESRLHATGPNTKNSLDLENIQEMNRKGIRDVED